MSNYFIKLSIAGVLMVLLFSACQLVNGNNKDSQLDKTGTLQITMEDAYQGVKDGIVELVPLPENSVYITIETCIKNLGAMDQPIQRQNVFITLGDHKTYPNVMGPSARSLEVFLPTENQEQIFPVALGYDEAEAFNWMLPFTQPIGVKRIPHKYYFFAIQKNELLRIPANQSVGCDTSAQYKSLALLFIVPKDHARQPYILHFFDGEIRFKAKKVFLISNGVKWGIGILSLGLFLALLLILSTVLVISVKRSKRKAILSQEHDQNSAQG